MQARRPSLAGGGSGNLHQGDVALLLCNEPSPESICVVGDCVVVIRPAGHVTPDSGRRGWGSGQGHLGFSPPWSLDCLYLALFPVYSC